MKHSCMCLQCGRGFELALDASENLEDKNCPICNGNNIVQHDSKSFFEVLFGGAGST